jgi:hypothetical protein
MPRSITVLVVTVGANPKRAGLEINTRGTWIKSEPGGADHVFRTRDGPYREIGGHMEMLRTGGGNRVGILRNFDPDTTTTGSTGQGLSDDTGSALTWTTERIIEI